MRRQTLAYGLIPVLVAAMAMPLPAATWSDYYTTEDIAPPEGVEPRLGGVDALDDGRLVFVFMGGEVYFYEPQEREWSRFAEGLHNPLGIHAASPEEIYVSHYPELTRLVDTTGDGVANRYESMNDEFGLSGWGEEMHFGLAVDQEGNFYTGLGPGRTVSSAEPRGEVNLDGGEELWSSPIAYRGWIIKTTPEGEMVPYASGLRMPNGMTVDSQGRILATANQGNWVGPNPLYHIEPSKFYGFAPSLVWEPEWDLGPPRDMHIRELDQRRTRPAAEFPYGHFSNSPSQPLEDTTDGAFGPFAGQIFVGEMNHPHLLRVMLEEVAGKVQSATTRFQADTEQMDQGNIRMAFDANGDLWLAKSQYGGWAGSTGIQRVSWTGRTPMEVQDLTLTDDGFVFTFTRPVDPATVPDADELDVERYRYRYDRTYRSPKIGGLRPAVEQVELSSDQRRLAVTLHRLVPRYLYHFDVSGIQSIDGHPMMHPEIVYTLQRRRDGSEYYRATVPSDGATVELDATVADLIGVMDLEQEHAGHTGTGYAVFEQVESDAMLDDGETEGLGGIVWQLDIEQPGRYEVSFRYALPEGSRTLRLHAGGQVVSEALAFAPTGSWTEWDEVSAEVELAAGRHRIELEQHEGRWPAIDRMTIRSLAR